MIQKLRRKIIRNNMIMVCLVLAAVLLSVITVSVYQTETNIQTSLNRAVASEQVPGLPQLDIPVGAQSGGGMQQNQQNQNMQPREEENGEQMNNLDQQNNMLVYVVYVNGDGEIVDTQGINVDVTDAMAQESVEQAAASGKTDGLLLGLRLQFASVSNEFGTRYAFVDISGSVSSLAIMSGVCLAIFAAAFVLFYLISAYSAKLAVKPVEEALQQQQQFLADASHELKTPLTVILANLNILNSHPGHTIAEEQKWVGYIQSEAARMKGLVESLLFLARADQKQNKPEKEQVNFSDLLWECLLPFESVAFESGLTCDYEIDDGLTLSANAGQLKQLVMILLDNACKYTDSGGSIRVNLKKTEEGCCLTVNNQGGALIPPEKLPHLFERFFRADDSRNWKKGGYGLGLAIAESVVKTHDGTITAESDQEHGTTFTVQLPVNA